MNGAPHINPPRVLWCKAHSSRQSPPRLSQRSPCIKAHPKRARPKMAHKNGEYTKMAHTIMASGTFEPGYFFNDGINTL